MVSEPITWMFCSFPEELLDAAFPSESCGLAQLVTTKTNNTKKLENLNFIFINPPFEFF